MLEKMEMGSKEKLSAGEGGGGNQSDDAYDSPGQDESSAGTPERTRSVLNVRRTRSQEAVRTLLASFGESADRSADEFLRQDIKFKDLSALTEDDLAMLGITDPEEQSLMLETFQELPSQEMHYDRLCNTREAQNFNEEILGHAPGHLNSMNDSLTAAYLKMRVDPPSNVLIDEKVFASRLVLDAIDELKKASDDIEDRLRALEHVAMRNAKTSSSFEHSVYKTLVVFGGVCTGVTLAYWYLKGR